MSIFKAIGKAASAVGKWIAGAFTWVQKKEAPFVVGIVEELQTFWKTGTPGFIASILDTLTKNQVPTNIVNALGAALPKVLAANLAIEGLPTDFTPEQFADFEQRVLAAFGVTDNKSKLYTSLGADLLGIVRKHTQPGQDYTWFTLASDLEEAYQDYLTLKAQDANDGEGTVKDPVQDPPLTNGQTTPLTP